MARIASTTSAGVGIPGSGMTLDALMARQKALAEAQGQIVAPRQITSPWQGAAQLAQAFVNARQGAYAEDQVAAGRAKLAELLSGVNPETGADPATAAQIYSLDPDAGARAMQMAAEAIRAKRQREQQLADRAEGRTYQEGQTAATRAYEEGQKVSDRAYESGTESAINERERREAIEAETRASETEAQRNERERLEAIAAEERAQAAEIAKEGRTATHYGPVITGEQATAVGLDATKSYQKNLKTDQYEPVGGAGGITIQNVPAEAAGRLGLATNFLDSYDQIQAEVDAGNLTGTDYVSSVILGRGGAGTAYRTIQSGSDSLLRNLTGAGMPASEAAKYVQRYEPTWTDDSATLHSKIEGLRTDLQNVQAAVTQGRKWLPQTDAVRPPDAATPPPAPTPEQYTVGQTYTFDDGSKATYKGGPAADANSWTIISPGGP